MAHRIRLHSARHDSDFARICLSLVLWRFHAFTDMSVFNYLSKEYKFVGFANFSAMLHDPETWILTYRTVIWTVINVFLHVSLGIVFAMLLSNHG